jgi:restriction system protein
VYQQRRQPGGQELFRQPDHHKATKGVLITTAGFSNSANDTARQIGNIILIGGEQLSQLMIEYGVGVITRSTYLVRRVDSEFFEEI